MSNVGNVIVSIITITYNAQHSIEKTIRSVIKQKYSMIEYIIIDGKSEDRTLKIIDKYRSYIDTVVSEKDRGIADAFNKGLSYAKGDLIFFLNAGDILVDGNVIANVAEEWQKTRPDIIFYKVKVGKYTFIPANFYKDNPVRIWNECQIPHQASFVRKEIFDKVGNFNTCLKTRMDYDFWARCKEYRCSYQYIPKIIALYETGGASMQIDNANTFYREGMGIKLMYHLPIRWIDIAQLVLPDRVRVIIRRYIKR